MRTLTISFFSRLMARKEGNQFHRVGSVEGKTNLKNHVRKPSEMDACGFVCAPLMRR